VELERYRGAKGAYPDSLTALTPDYLPQVPQDPFDGQPLRYHPTKTGYRLYSVGLILQDSGGQVADANRSRLDGTLVFEVVNAPPVSAEFNRSAGRAD
jgi:hypothetical protein